MSNDLIKSTLQDAGLMVSEQEEQLLGELSTGKTFLPRIQLMQAMSAQVNKEPPEAAKGDYLLVINKSEFHNFGREFVCVPVTFRLKATEFSPDGTIRSFFDITTPEFIRVKDKAQSDGFDSGCLAGPEFLLWLPDLKRFATYHLTSQTAQGIAKTLRGLQGSPAVIKASIQTNRKKQTYFMPTCSAFNGEISAYPEPAILKDEANSFRNPKSSEIEDAEESSDTGRAR